MKQSKVFKKRAFALFLALMMCVSMTQIPVFAAETPGHTHNQDGWQCEYTDPVTVTECTHQHDDNCYKDGERVLTCHDAHHMDSCYDENGELICNETHEHDESCYTSGEKVLNCTHECGADCVKVVTEGYWTCSAPTAEETYATVDELNAAFAAVQDALEAEDIQGGINAIDNYIAVYNRLSPEDQIDNADVYDYVTGYQETLRGMLEGIPDPEIDTLASNYQIKLLVCCPDKGISDLQVGYDDTVPRSDSGYIQDQYQIPYLSSLTTANYGRVEKITSNAYFGSSKGEGSWCDLSRNNPNVTFRYYVTDWNTGSSGGNTGTGDNTTGDDTLPGDGNVRISFRVIYHSNYPEGTNYTATRTYYTTVRKSGWSVNVFNFPYKSYSDCGFGGYDPKVNENTWYNDAACTKGASKNIYASNGAEFHVYAGWKQDQNAYYSVTWYDADTGAVLDTLNRAGIVGNTVAVTDADKKYDGYIFKADDSRNKLSTTLTASGTELKLYFTNNQVTVTWYDEYGITVLDGPKTFDKGDNEPTTNVTPTKAEDENYTYEFKEWVKMDDSTEDAIKYKATYTATPKPKSNPVEISKSIINPMQVAVGDIVTYTVTITNKTNKQQTVTFKDDLAGGNLVIGNGTTLSIQHNDSDVIGGVSGSFTDVGATFTLAAKVGVQITFEYTARVAANATGTLTNKATATVDEITVEASAKVDVITPETVTVTYKNEDDVIAEDKDIRKGSSYDVKGLPAGFEIPEGKEFDGWSGDDNKDYTQNDKIDSLNNNLVLTAKWKDKEIEPSITIEKIVVEKEGGYKTGDTVEWEVTVSNTSEDTVNNLKLTDSIEGVTITGPEGIDHNNFKLDAGENVTFTVTLANAKAGTYTNIATVKKDDTVLGKDIAEATVTNGTGGGGGDSEDNDKGIKIEKTLAAINGKTNVAEAKVGDVIVWNVKVTNLSNVEKTVNLTEKLSGATLSKNSVKLAKNASETVTATYTVQSTDKAGKLTNIVIGEVSRPTPENPDNKDISEGKDDSVTIIEQVTITVKFVDEKGDSVGKPIVKTVNKNSDYDVTKEATTIPEDYDKIIKTEGNLQGNADSNKIITVTVGKNTESAKAHYTVEWYDILGTPIKEALERSGVIGSTVKVTDDDKKIEGYTYVGDSDSRNILSATLAASGTVLKLYFTKDSGGGETPDNPSEYTVTVKYQDENGNSIAGYPDVTVNTTDGGKYDVTDKQVTIPDYTFNRVLDNKPLFGTISESTEIILVYTKNPDPLQHTYTLRYDANGGTNPPIAESVGPVTDESHTFTVSGTVPTRSNYTFLGWADTDNADAAQYLAGASITLNATAEVPNPTKTVYAVWRYNGGGSGGGGGGGSSTPRPSNPSTPSDPATNIPDTDTPLTNNPGSDPTVNIPDGDTPLTDLPVDEPSVTDIPDSDTPAADSPDGDASLTDISDEVTPLDDAPQTGDDSMTALWTVLCLLALIIMAGAALAPAVIKRRK